MVYVLLRGELTTVTPELEQDVILKIMESIARIAPIKTVSSCYSVSLSIISACYNFHKFLMCIEQENLEVRIYTELQEDACMLNKTFSGKTKRQAFRSIPESQGYHLPPWRQDSSDQCVVAC